MSVVDGIAAGAIIGGTLLLLASPLLYRGMKHRARYRRFRELPAETPATATPGETALVTGTAREGEGGTIVAPLSERPALFAAWDIHSLRRYGFGVKHVWAPEALGIDTGGFDLRERDTQVAVPDWSRQDRTEGTERLQMTGTGMMPVEGLDVGGLWVEIEAFDTETRVLPGDELPDQCQDLLSRVGIDVEELPSRLLPRLPRLRTPEGTIQYREETVEGGEQVTVLGRVEESQTPDGQLRLAEPADRPPLVSPLDPEQLIRRYRWSYWKSVHGLGFVILVFATVCGVVIAL